MDTGYRIVSGDSIRGPQGARTRWWLRFQNGFDAIWGPAGDSGWRLVGNCFVDPRGRETSYFVTTAGDVRLIHGPEARLPWE